MALPTDRKEKGLRLAAVADIHCRDTSVGIFYPLFVEMGRSADVVVLCGDLTDHGLVAEARVLAEEVTSAVKVPIVAVLGNHDFESGQQAEVTRILTEAGISVLDGDAVEIGGVGFAGVKGFAGGFGARTLQPWGEEIIKRFVHETVEEALKLESALAKLRSGPRVALLHYSPVHDTVEGEAPEIIPFLGSSRLVEPLDRFPPVAVLHGHAHFGSPEGKTPAGTPVYNVAMPMLRRVFPDRPPFRIVEVPLEARIPSPSRTPSRSAG